ncbi:MAG TPA: hypothetical protein PKN32_02770 [Bacteroidales bacterium]|nr:hypothetical protein [Bacteroidales bacterium]
MNLINKTFTTLVLLIICLNSFSQKIKNVAFKQVGNSIVVNYEINLPELRIAYVDLYVSLDGGRSYNGPLKQVTGDISEICTSGKKSITWHVFDEYEKLNGHVSFEVRAKLKCLPFEMESFAEYNISGTSTIGLTYGEVKNIGWYGRVKTNGGFTIADYKADDTRILDYTGEGYYTFTNEVKHNRFGITGGLVYRVKPVFYLYAGAGFGSRALYWNAKEYSILNSEEIGDIWAKNVNNSFLGGEIELGMMFRIKRFNISFGINSINFKFYEANAGIGFFFDRGKLFGEPKSILNNND